MEFTQLNGLDIICLSNLWSIPNLHQTQAMGPLMHTIEVTIKRIVLLKFHPKNAQKLLTSVHTIFLNKSLFLNLSETSISSKNWCFECTEIIC